MHVLITSDTLNGNWTYTRELVSGLITRGLRVTLVSFGEIPLPDQTAWMERLHGLAYHPTAFRLDWMQEGQQNFDDASAYLCSLVKETRPDVFHSNHLCYGALPVAIPRVVREMVIHHGRNPIFFNPYVAKEDSVLAIGRLLDPAKQVNLLTQQTHPVPVCIVGDDGPEQSPRVPVRADVKFSDGDAGISLKGPQTEAELRLLYSRAALYAGTYRYDPSGMAVLEAALSRCALILNDIPSLHEIWGPAAVYFRTNESESLAEAVRILSADVQLRRNFANRAFQRARECFNAHRMKESCPQSKSRSGKTALIAWKRWKGRWSCSTPTATSST